MLRRWFTHSHWCLAQAWSFCFHCMVHFIIFSLRVSYYKFLVYGGYIHFSWFTSLSRILLSQGMQLYNSISINTFKLHGSLGSSSLGSWITGFYYSLVHYGRLMDIFRFSWFSRRRCLLSSAVRNLSSCRHQALQRNSIHRSYHYVRFSFYCLSTRSSQLVLRSQLWCSYYIQVFIISKVFIIGHLTL